MAQLVNNSLEMQETLVWFLGWEDPPEKELAAHSIILGFPGGSDGKESAYNVEDLGLIPGLVRPAGGEHGNPFRYTCLENLHGQSSLAGYSPWGGKESDTTEQLSTTQGKIV